VILGSIEQNWHGGRAEDPASVLCGLSGLAQYTGYRKSGVILFFVNGGRHELASTVHPLGRPVIWILAEEPGCFV
jgi:hypothetical protein